MFRLTLEDKKKENMSRQVLFWDGGDFYVFAYNIPLLLSSASISVFFLIAFLPQKTINQPIALFHDSNSVSSDTSSDETRHDCCLSALSSVPWIWTVSWSSCEQLLGLQEPGLATHST